jgi:hypothetical protein
MNNDTTVFKTINIIIRIYLKDLKYLEFEIIKIN